MNKYEQLFALLDTLVLNNDAWLSRLQNIRNQADHALNIGKITLTQWSSLVARSANIQDSICIRLDTV